MGSHSRFAFASIVFLTACGGHRTVPDAALAYVPSGSIAEINVVQEQVHTYRAALEAAERSLASLEEQVEGARRAVKEADVSVDEATAARAVAVRVGDAERARSLADDLTATRARLEERERAAASLDARVELAEEQVEARRAALELQIVNLELERAKAAVSGGADLKLERYERQAEKARQSLADAVADVDELESAGVSNP